MLAAALASAVLYDDRSAADSSSAQQEKPHNKYSAFERVSVLSEALPYLQKFRNKIIVVKYGGAAMKDPALKV